MPVDNKIIQRLIEQREVLKRHIEEKNKELQQIDSAIASLQGNAQNATRYNWSELALECIKKQGVFLQTNEIADKVLDDNQELGDERSRRSVLVAISIAVNNLCLKGSLRKIVVQGVKGHFYGLPEWFENNHPKKEYIANFMARFGKATSPLKLNIEDLGTSVPGAGSL
jgi:hypothetical protein